jgi:hypothetical protein
MLTFLFWNLNGQPLQSLVARLAHDHDVDVLMLAECSLASDDLLAELNHGQVRKFSPPDRHSLCERIMIFPRFSNRFLTRVVESGKHTFRQVRAPGNQTVLLGVVHLGSKLHRSPASQSQAATGLRYVVEQAEKRVGHNRTVLVGDWNMNPFEDGMVSAAGLHGVMTRALASQVSRVIDGEPYRFFFNPMWGLFGDTTPGPPGSYYYRSSEHVAHFWHLFDQMLLRPELLPFFRAEDLFVLDRADTTSLLSKAGLPDRTTASDHLPLLFRLRL